MHASFMYLLYAYTPRPVGQMLFIKSKKIEWTYRFWEIYTYACMDCTALDKLKVSIKL